MKITFTQPNEFALIKHDENGRVMQIAITTTQNEQLQAFLNLLSNEYPLVEMGEEYDLVLKSSLKNKFVELKSQSVETLDLPVRVFNVFRNLKVKTIEDLCEYSKKDLSKIRGLGFYSVSLIISELEKINIELD